MSTSQLSALSNVGEVHSESTVRKNAVTPVLPQAVDGKKCVATAIVYCEANFGDVDGKTANGLVRSSERYEILSVIDVDERHEELQLMVKERVR